MSGYERDATSSNLRLMISTTEVGTPLGLKKDKEESAQVLLQLTELVDNTVLHVESEYNVVEKVEAVAMYMTYLLSGFMSQESSKRAFAYTIEVQVTSLYRAWTQQFREAVGEDGGTTVGVDGANDGFVTTAVGAIGDDGGTTDEVDGANDGFATTAVGAIGDDGGTTDGVDGANDGVATTAVGAIGDDGGTTDGASDGANDGITTTAIGGIGDDGGTIDGRAFGANDGFATTAVGAIVENGGTTAGASVGKEIVVPATVWYFMPPLEQAPMVKLKRLYLPVQLSAYS